MKLDFRPMKEEISVKWHFTDVLSVRPKLTDNQAMIVLGEVEHNHDANVGVNWETIEVVADSLFPYD